jgi:tetratricopeptide (TPR) repeat protein
MDIRKNHKILNDINTLCTVGNYYIAENQHKKALFYYASALKLHQTSSQLWSVVALLYYVTGQTHLAKLCLNKAITLEPNCNNIKIVHEIMYKKQRFSKKLPRFSTLVR